MQISCNEIFVILHHVESDMRSQNMAMFDSEIRVGTRVCYVRECGQFSFTKAASAHLSAFASFHILITCSLFRHIFPKSPSQFSRSELSTTNMAQAVDARDAEFFAAILASSQVTNVCPLATTHLDHC